MSAKNFQEYLASTGRANSGLSAQARMQYGNNLNSSINYLNAGEAAALADINRRRTLANDTYNSGLASANAQIEADYINNLLNQRNKELDRQLQEKQFNESVRQFNENLKLQREQLQSRFSSGSGGGGYTYQSVANNETNNTQTGSKPMNYDSIKVGQLYAVDTGTKTIWYQKQANGKDKVVASPYATVQANAKATVSTKNTKKTNKNTTKKTTTTANKNNPFPKKTFGK